MLTQAVRQEARDPRSTVLGRAALVPVAALSLVLVLRATPLQDSAVARTFVLVFTSIVVEALPFILLGALVSALIEVFVPDSIFDRIARLPLPFQIPGAALGGLALPVCECGSIPVARRLIARGLHQSAGLAFMLAAPVINPVVLFSTYVAYKDRGFGLKMVTGRAVVGLGVAIFVGWLLGSGRVPRLLRAGTGDPTEPSAPAGSHTHLHFHGDEATGRLKVRRNPVLELSDHLATDFFFMARFVVLGGAFAALLQTAIPQSIGSALASNVIVASLTMMGLAFMLSLCSEADAFVAVSFTDFGFAPQLAFLVFGPALDTKLALLYGAIFRKGFVLMLLLVLVPAVLFGVLLFERIAL